MLPTQPRCCRACHRRRRRRRAVAHCIRGRRLHPRRHRSVPAMPPPPTPLSCCCLLRTWAPSPSPSPPQRAVCAATAVVLLPRCCRRVVSPCTRHHCQPYSRAVTTYVTPVNYLNISPAIITIAVGLIISITPSTSITSLAARISRRHCRHHPHQSPTALPIPSTHDSATQVLLPLFVPHTEFTEQRLPPSPLTWMLSLGYHLPPPATSTLAARVPCVLNRISLGSPPINPPHLWTCFHQRLHLLILH